LKIGKQIEKQIEKQKEANSRNLAKLFERFGRRASGPICYFKYLELLVFSKTVLGKLGKNGGEGEIRTHGGISPSPVFKTGALNHSATSPRFVQFCLKLNSVVLPA
jgi:hypothetical protein